MPVVKRRRADEDDDDRRDEEERPRSRRRDEDDEERDERPRRSRSRDDDEEDDDRPRRRRDRDEEDEDERPKRRRDRDDDDEGDDRPRSKRRARDDDDEDDEEPEERSRKEIRSGWSGFKEGKSKHSDFPEDDPFATYHQHWIDSPPNGIKKKSWTCLEDDCPLCKMGDRPRLLSLFNVIHLSTGGDPINKVMELGVKAAGQLLNFAEDRKTGPLSKMYYAISKSGKGQQTAYNFRPVKDRDLEEDWEMEPLSDDELDEAMEHLYDKKIVQRPSRAQLKELAVGLSADD
jgi:hypothetical protein